MKIYAVTCHFLNPFLFLFFFKLCSARCNEGNVKIFFRIIILFVRAYLFDLSYSGMWLVWREVFGLLEVVLRFTIRLVFLSLLKVTSFLIMALGLFKGLSFTIGTVLGHVSLLTTFVASAFCVMFLLITVRVGLINACIGVIIDIHRYYFVIGVRLMVSSIALMLWLELEPFLIWVHHCLFICSFL